MFVQYLGVQDCDSHLVNMDIEDDPFLFDDFLVATHQAYEFCETHQFLVRLPWHAKRQAYHVRPASCVQFWTQCIWIRLPDDLLQAHEIQQFHPVFLCPGVTDRYVANIGSSATPAARLSPLWSWPATPRVPRARRGALRDLLGKLSLSFWLWDRKVGIEKVKKTTTNQRNRQTKTNKTIQTDNSSDRNNDHNN